MTSDSSGNDPEDDATQSSDEIDDTPEISCSRCDRTWDLSYELDDLQVGNRAPEQFALDHYHHTGHYPDDSTPWIADCRQCPDTELFLSRRPTRRFAETHARHTGHTVEVEPPEGERVTVEPSEVR